MPGLVFILISNDLLFPGFLHEHNRPDRSSYVTVIAENILDSRKSDFKKRNSGNSEWFDPGDVDTQNTPFDFQSVLLYPPALSGSKSISKNGEKTLKYNAPLIQSWPNFPPNEEPLTVIDTVELGLAYSCKLSQETIVQYIHYNRLSSTQKISVLESKTKLLEQTVEDQKVSCREKIDLLESKMKLLEQTVEDQKGISSQTMNILETKQVRYAIITKTIFAFLQNGS